MHISLTQRHSFLALPPLQVWDTVPYGQSQVLVTAIDGSGRLLGGTLYSSFIR